MKWFKSIFDRRNEEEEAVSKVSPSIALVPTEGPRPQSLPVPSGKVPCKNCGKPILAMTAERTGGVCMPCSQRHVSTPPPSVATPALTGPLSAGPRIRAVHLLVESPALALAAGAAALAAPTPGSSSFLGAALK